MGCRKDARARRFLRPAGADVLNHELSTGCATPKAASLHPWLHPAAPLGRTAAVPKPARLWRVLFPCIGRLPLPQHGRPHGAVPTTACHHGLSRAGGCRGCSNTRPLKWAEPNAPAAKPESNLVVRGMATVYRRWGSRTTRNQGQRQRRPDPRPRPAKPTGAVPDLFSGL